MKNLRAIGKIEAGVLVTVLMISGVVSAGSFILKQSADPANVTPNYEWIREAIYEQGSTEIYCTSLVFDQNDDPHVFYITTSKELKRSFRTSIGWFHDTVDTRVTGAYVSAKMDSNGLMHVSYANEKLVYITGDCSGWNEKEIVDPEIILTKNCFISLDLDSNDKPHISYYDGINKDLRYAKKVRDKWQITVVDFIGNVGEYSSIALDSNDKVHIAYYDATNKDLKYAVKPPELNFLTMVADADNNFGLYASIAIDQENRPHIVHSGLKGVKHTFEREPQMFISEMIDEDKTQCFTPSIVIDNANTIHVGYSKTAPGGPSLDIDLMYAKKVTVRWQKEKAVDGEPFRFFAYGVDINLDDENNPAMSYVDIISGKTLEYVFKRA